MPKSAAQAAVYKARKASAEDSANLAVLAIRRLRTYVCIYVYIEHEVDLLSVVGWE